MEEEIENPSSSFNRLPDEIILKLFSKIIDFKTLWICYLVCKRFASLVLQIDAISFTTPCFNPPESDHKPSGHVESRGSPKKIFRSSVHLLFLRNLPKPPLPPAIPPTSGDPFRSAVSFLGKFKRLKYLSIQIPYRSVSTSYSCKWMMGKFGSRIESLSVLFHKTMHKKAQVLGLHGLEEQGMMISDNFGAVERFPSVAECMKDAIVMHKTMLYLVNNLEMLQEIAVTDSDKRGKLSLKGEKLIQVKDWLCSVSETERPQLKDINFEGNWNNVFPFSLRYCYVPMLELPYSGYVMKEAFAFFISARGIEGYDDDYVVNGFGDGEAGLYCEALLEIMSKYKNSMMRHDAFVPGAGN